MSMSALNPPEPYSAIIFDCDGTLVDFNPPILSRLANAV
jgi:beta-phosphoglucomutase-like phosphatase (HAD superfamily)